MNIEDNIINIKNTAPKARLIVVTKMMVHVFHLFMVVLAIIEEVIGDFLKML